MGQPRRPRDALDDEAWSRSFDGEHDADSVVSSPCSDMAACDPARSAAAATTQQKEQA
jgi:hypothetical protein